MDASDVSQIETINETIKDFYQLQEFHKERLEAAEADLEKWEKFLNDYNTLRSRITTLPHEISYDAMVPIGPLAFMPGQLIHTNEILVLLGENWFANRSAKEACDIIGRRIEVCQGHLEDAKTAVNFHKNWLEVSKKMEADANTVDIVEEFSEADYKKTKEKRCVRIVETPKDDSSSQDQKSYNDLMKRLDQLEMEEEMQETSEDSDETSSDSEAEAAAGYEDDDDDHRIPFTELENEPGASGGGQDQATQSKKAKLERRVSWADQMNEFLRNKPSDGGSGGAAAAATAASSKITYRSIGGQPSNQCAEDRIDVDKGNCDDVKEVDMDDTDVTSPQSHSDLYKMFKIEISSDDSSAPKGILKKTMSDPHVEEFMKLSGDFAGGEPMDSSAEALHEDLPLPSKRPLSESPKEMKNVKPAFNYMVTSHNVKEEEKTRLLQEEDQVPEPAPEPRKMSRFKASRLNQ